MSTVSRETMLEMLQRMYLIRRFELKMQEIFKKKAAAGEFVGALHSYEGQEAIAVGVGVCLRKDDYVFSTHRGHGHALAKGLNLDRVVAELLGKESGCCGGRGGSMHLFDVDHGFLGGNGIVGGGLPLALGSGFSAVYRGTDQVTVCFFGEGAASQGSFHESLNMASLHKYPILYVCENNLYAATTHVRKNCPIPNIADRAAGYAIPGIVVDGNDVLAVQQAASEAIGAARAGNGPSLLECKTYRHRPHCMVIPEHRPPEELESWKARDPIPQFEKRLQADGVATAMECERVHAAVEDRLQQAIDRALESSFPDPQTATNGFWAD